MLQDALAPSTKRSYRKSWDKLKNYWGCTYPQQPHLCLPISSMDIALFMVHLRREGLSPASIATCVSAISYVHKLLGIPDPAATFLVRKTLVSLQKTTAPVDSRLPITLPLLQKLLRALDFVVTLAYHRSLFKSIMSTAFFGLFRMGELLVTNDPDKVVQLGQITIKSTGLSVKIKDFKHNSTARTFKILLAKQPNREICPHSLMAQYLLARGTQHGPLFTFPAMKGVPRRIFDDHLRKVLTVCGLNTSAYKGHSFRIGGASLAAEKGFSDAKIRLLGRWKSDAFKKYIRNPHL